MDQVRDAYNRVHACEVASEAERDIGIWRASGFNELFKATLKKECEQGEVHLGLGPGLADDAGSGSKGKGQEKQQFGPEVEEIKKLTKHLVKEAGEQAVWKWTWDMDLNHENLYCLIRGADSQYQVPHSGYNEDLLTGALLSVSSEASDPADLDNKDVWFNKLSTPINLIPKLRTPEIQRNSFLLLGSSRDPIAKLEPNPVIDAFAKRARTKKKLLMQGEVDQPVEYLNLETEFCPQSALITQRPWLTPYLPIILPPSNIVHDTTN